VPCLLRKDPELYWNAPLMKPRGKVLTGMSIIQKEVRGKKGWDVVWHGKGRGNEDGNERGKETYKGMAPLTLLN